MEYATFGSALHRRRCEYLAELRSVQRALVLGDGDGRFTAELLRQNPSVFVDSLELSESMSRVAATRIASCPNGPSRIRQVCEDARTAHLAGSYDLVTSHFFLDCFTTDELQALVPRITAHLNTGGRWLISEFEIPPAGLRRHLATLLVKALYVSFRILTGLRTNRLPDYRSVLKSNGYVLTASNAGMAGMLVSEIWQHA